MPIFRLNRFQQQFLDSTAPNVTFAGGWGNGKTTAGILKAVEHAMKYKERARIFLLRQTWLELKDTTLVEFDAIVPKKLISKRGTRDSPHPQRTFTNGAVVKFRYVGDTQNKEAQLEHLSSINATLVIVDQAEEITERAYNTLSGRLRGGGDGVSRQLCLLCNMKGHNFIWRDFKFNLQPGNELIEAPTSANWQNLPDDYRLRLERLSPKWRSVYLEGNWDAFAGAVWDVEDYNLIGDPDPSLREDLLYENIPGADGCYGSMDFGVNSPTAFYFGAHLPGDILVVYKELYKIGLLTDFKAQLAKIKTKRETELLGAAYLDPHCWAQDQQTPSWFAPTRSNVAAKWAIRDSIVGAPNGFPVKKANNSRDYGLNLVGELLAFDAKLINPFTNEYGSPRLFIHRSCVELLKEITVYEFAEGKTYEDIPIKSATDTGSTPDHGCDCVRYLAATGPWRHYGKVKEYARGAPEVRRRQARSMARNFMGA